MSSCEKTSLERLQKVLARCGYGARRQCEELIRAGRVMVNGKVAHLGQRVDPDRDQIVVDGRPLREREPLVYLLLYKPAGYVTTRRDPHAPRTVMQLVRGVPASVFPVGRLDADAEGVLLLTNDGELASRLLHPRYGVEKVYRVLVRGRPTAAALRRLREGVVLNDGKTAPAKVCLLYRGQDRSELEITLHEGRKRQVKRMCQAVGHPVQRLTRVRFGQLTLGDLKPGQWRYLTPEEVELYLKSCLKGC